MFDVSNIFLYSNPMENIKLHHIAIMLLVAISVYPSYSISSCLASLESLFHFNI